MTIAIVILGSVIGAPLPPDPRPDLPPPVYFPPPVFSTRDDRTDGPGGAIRRDRPEVIDEPMSFRGAIGVFGVTPRITFSGPMLDRNGFGLNGFGFSGIRGFGFGGFGGSR